MARSTRTTIHGHDHSKLHLIGWAEGEHWERGWQYFNQAWSIMLDSLRSHLDS